MSVTVVRDNAAGTTTFSNVRKKFYVIRVPPRSRMVGSSSEFLDLLAKTKKRQDEQYDDDEADEVNNVVHVISPGRG